ncbi:hypothetical protein CSR02_05115 [Acetobacter pomorum]|uniref:Uncharacterized protein n=1 Tax=Acetobacter pomorum TaxID=65959 RepID=A0A2G4RG24_9PROT|nr:hypothetical protein CSR02_05115 [Acetobacter pomorum]
MSDEWVQNPRRAPDPQDKRPLWQEKTCNFTANVGEKLSPNYFHPTSPRECFLCLQASRKRGLSRFWGKLCHGSFFLSVILTNQAALAALSIASYIFLTARSFPFNRKNRCTRDLWLAHPLCARHATGCTIKMRPTTRA